METATDEVHGMRRRNADPDAKYYFVPGQAVFDSCAIKNPTSGEMELAEEYYYALGDPALIALRESFSLTYPGRSWDEDSKKRLEQIKAATLKPLKALGEILSGLGLDPVGAAPEENKASLFKLVIIPTGILPPNIKLPDLLPADPILIALRKILSMTFSEAYEIPDFMRVFGKIRKVAGTALLPYNDVLEYLEIEPVANPKGFNPSD